MSDTAVGTLTEGKFPETERPRGLDILLQGVEEGKIDEDQLFRSLLGAGQAGPVDPRAVTKPTSTFLEKGIIEGEKRLIEIDELIAGFDESFSTTFFQLGAELENKLDRFPKVKGFVEPALAKLIPAGDREKFEAFYEHAFLVDTFMFAARKDITGVAGGAVEMSRIEKFLPNIDQDAPRRFASKVRVQRLLTQKAVNHYKELRRRGIDDTTGMSEKQALETRTNTILGFARQAKREIAKQDRDVNRQERLFRQMDKE